MVLTWHDHGRNFVLEMFFRELQGKSHDASLSAPHRHHAAQERQQTLDAYRPTFDPHLDIATVVFSHVQCVKTRVNLALVSKLWRDASKPAAAYPLRFDFDAFPDMPIWTRSTLIIAMLDNDEALSLPYERVVGLLGEAAEYVCNYAACRGSVRLLKWTRENNLAWSANTCSRSPNGHCPLSSTCTRTGALGTRHVPYAAIMDTCPLSSTCTRTGALGDSDTCLTPPIQTLGLPAVRGG